MNNLFDLRPKMQMGHGPIGAVKFSGSIYKTSGGLRLGEGCTAIDGVHLGWDGPQPGVGRGAQDAGRRTMDQSG